MGLRCDLSFLALAQRRTVKGATPNNFAASPTVRISFIIRKYTAPLNLCQLTFHFIYRLVIIPQEQARMTFLRVYGIAKIIRTGQWSEPITRERMSAFFR